MRDLINDFVKFYDQNDEFKRQLDAYYRLLNSDNQDWKFIKGMYATLRRKLLEEMLSAKFTALDPVEKDARQRGYYYIVQMLDFLEEPLATVQAKKNRWTINIPNLTRKERNPK